MLASQGLHIVLMAHEKKGGSMNKKLKDEAIKKAFQKINVPVRLSEKRQRAC